MSHFHAVCLECEAECIEAVAADARLWALEHTDETSHRVDVHRREDVDEETIEEP